VAVAAVNQGLGSGGGTTQILAQVTDDGGNPIGGVPVTFSTDQGSITPSITTTDASGNATASLSTTATATVTAAAGTQTATVKVNVGLRGLSSFTVSPTSASTGVPVTFTVTPTANANVSNVTVNFGDGSSQQIGAISSAATVSHTYAAPGNYTATATSTDATGANSSLSTSVTIGSLPVGLTASPSPGTANSPITFTVTGLTTAQIDHVQYTYDDGTTHASTSTTDTHVFAQRGIHTARVDVIGIGGGQIGTASTQVDVQ
jgi:PKD repeat protein